MTHMQALFLESPSVSADEETAGVDRTQLLTEMKEKVIALFDESIGV